MDLPIKKPLKKWSVEDIKKLVDNGVAESRTLDFKLQPSLNQGVGNKKKRANNLEFCKDISAFANSLGGILIYGVPEKKDRGKYGKYPGFDLPPKKDFASFKQDLLDVLVGNLEPNIPESLIEIHEIPFYEKSSTHFMVIKIFQSPLSPHAFKKNEKGEDGEIIFGKGFHFYHRTGTTNSPMDIQQIREAFVNTESRHEKIKKTLKERTSRLADHSGPYNFCPNAFWALQISPLYPQGSPLFFRPQALLNLAEEVFQDKKYPSRDLSFSLGIDGISGQKEIKQRENISRQEERISNTGLQEFLQFYRDGSLEIIKKIQLEQPHDEKRFIFLDYSKNLIETLQKSSFFLHQAEIPLPYFFSISFHGVKEWTCRFEFPENQKAKNELPFPKNDLYFPIWEMDKIPDSEPSTKDLLREFSMLFYQTFGVPRGLEDLKNLDKK